MDPEGVAADPVEGQRPNVPRARLDSSCGCATNFMDVLACPSIASLVFRRLDAASLTALRCTCKAGLVAVRDHTTTARWDTKARGVCPPEMLLALSRSSPHLERLRISGRSDVWPRGPAICAEGLVALLAACTTESGSCWQRSLRHLEAASNELGPPGMCTLSMSLTGLQSLASLDLWGNKLGAGGARLLAAVDLPLLRSLNVSYNNLQAGGVAALCSAPFASRLQKLDLQSNAMGPDGARCLAAVLWPCLAVLGLGHNDLLGEGLEALLSPFASAAPAAAAASSSAAATSSSAAVSVTTSGTTQQHAPEIFPDPSSRSQPLPLPPSSADAAHSTPPASSAGPRFPSLERLDLQFNQLGPRGAEALGQLGEACPALRVLSLRANALPPACGSALAAATWPTLHEQRQQQRAATATDSCPCYHSYAAASSFATVGADTSATTASPTSKAAGAYQGYGKLCRLEHLDLAYNKLGDEGVEALAGAALPSLSDLELYDNEIGEEGGRALAGAQLARLTRLNVGANRRLADGGAAALAAAALPRLVRLQLCKCRVGSSGVAALSRAAWRSGCMELDLSECEIGDTGAAALAAAAWPQLRTLKLASCGIGHRGATSLAEGSEMPRLRALYLGKNAISDEGVVSLSRTCAPDLRSLGLCGASFGTEGRVAMRMAGWTEEASGSDSFSYSRDPSRPAAPYSPPPPPPPVLRPLEPRSLYMSPARGWRDLLLRQL